MQRPGAARGARLTTSAAVTPYYLYLLECEDGTLYTGVALDVEQRFIRHVLGMGAAYTRSHPPRRVLACRCYPGKGEALSAEYALKQIRREHTLQFFKPFEQLADAHLSLHRQPTLRTEN